MAIEGFRLSPQQQHLWSLQQFDQSVAYRTHCAVMIEGEVDADILEMAIRKVWNRHEILHTAFRCLSGTDGPVQVITDDGKLSINSYDLSGYDSRQQEVRLTALCHEANQLPFDFEQGRLSHLSLATLSPSSHMLLVDLSSLCADPASLRNLVWEICLAYKNRANRGETEDQPAQYADLAEWQNELLESEDTKAGKDYWRGQDFSDFNKFKLPCEDQSCGKPGFQPLARVSTVDFDGLAKIAKLARKYDVSTSAFLLASWQILLWRLSGGSNFVVGMACDGRTYEGLQDAVGPLSKFLPLRCHLEGNLQFAEILRQVNEVAREAVEWQEYFRWEHIAGANGDLDAPPFFAASFEFQEQPSKYSAADLIFTIHSQSSCTDKFKLKLSCVQKEDLLVVELHYDSSLFHAEDISRLNEQFQRLLESVVCNPEAAISELEILSEAQRRQLIAEFNATKTDYDNDKTIHQLFEEGVERTPEGVAVVFDQQRLSYAELNARANQLAHWLRTAGVGPGVLVAICIERSLEIVVGLLGILKAGGCYVPIDPSGPRERMAFMLVDTGAAVLLTQKHLLDRIPENVGQILCLDSEWETVARNSEANPSNIVTVRDAAYVIYTSGSTGLPKGVIVEHRGLSNTVNWIIETLELSPADSCLLKTPVTFDAAGRELFPTLLTGGTLVIVEPGRQGDCGYLAETMRSEEISILHCVPSLLRLLIEEPAFDDNLRLRAVMCGGEMLSAQLVARFQHRSRAKLYNVYGPTEASIDTSCWLCQQVTTDSSIAIGRPIPNSTIYILDELLRPVPIGVGGELHIGGVGLARGYLDRPELTAEKFIPNPFCSEAGARLYKSGDLARYMPDGNIEYLGRVDHQVKIRGFRIELEEIEAVLRGHPAVREAAVMAYEDASVERRLVAYLVTDQERPATSNDLRVHLKEKVPEYMVPADFVTLDALPLMSNGKVDRHALPAPGRTQTEMGLPFVLSRTPTEEMVVQIWAQLLNVERIGIHDNFFHLGGHSLLATQVVSRLREAFQVDLPLRRIFELPTVAGLSESIELTRQAGHKLAPPILPTPRDGELPLSFAQQRLWFIDQLDPGNSVYNFPAAVRLTGPLDLVALKQSINEIVKRHEVLRTTFVSIDGRPAQVIAQTAAVTLELVDLRDLSETGRETEVLRLAVAEARRPFDLAKGPLLRASLLQLHEQEYVGLLTMHHIVADGWSTGVLIREMAVLYEAFSSGKSSPLTDLPIQYADFAHWQRQWLRDEILEVQLDYWKRQLSGAAQLELSTDRPRPPVQTFRGAHQVLVLSSDVKAKLKTLSRQHGVTTFMALVAAFKALMHRYTGQDDIIVGTPIANRNRLEVEGLIGFFANTLVLRTDLSGNPSFSGLLRRVREVCLGAFVHQDLPFERLVEELHLERDLSRNPIFQVMFVLRNASGQVLELPGLTMSPLEVDSGTTHFDLILHMTETEQELSGELVYNTDLFEPTTIARVLDHFRILLDAVVADPEQHLSDLSLLSEAEQYQLLVEWNDNKTNYPDGSCIHQLFETQVERTPDAIAVVFEAERLTYRELNRRANQLAHYLRNLGVGPEVPVGIRLEHSLEEVVGLLGILKAGGAYVPLDPAYPKERTAFMIADTQMPVLLTQERLMEGLPQHATAIVNLDSEWKNIATESEENPVGSTVLENLAYVIYTSGSSGQPKGVLVSLRSITNHCRDIARCYELDSNDRVLQFASLSFDLSLEEILPTLMVGATLIVQGAKICPTAQFHEVIAKYGLTVLNLPTAYWQELAREWEDRPALIRKNNRPRVVIVGGEVMSPEALGHWQKTPLHNVRLINAYGPTEATITATAFEITPPSYANPTFRRVPIGRPLANREIYVLDRYGNPAPVGVVGELHLGGTGLARGYLNRTELTAEKFIPNRFSREAGGRLYKSGDLARYKADGNIEFLGRVDHQVKIRGFRVEPAEIEAVLAGHPAVHEAAVVAQEDPLGERRLVAYVVTEQERVVTTADLRMFLKEKMPEYMVPADFVTLDTLPLMQNGKVDRRALPIPDRSRPALEKAFVAPRNALERQLTQLWEEVLGIQPIGIRDNFFELGGHSLAAVRLFSLIEKRLGKKLPLASVFQGATIEQLANILRNQAKPTKQSLSLVAIQPAGDKPPLFLMHPAGGHVFPYVHLAHCLGIDRPCYGLQARGLEEGQEPHTRIEDMAAYYIEALQTLQPVGPYFLGGWSAGGVVAFEMAQQLHAQGHYIALLALLDARIPTPEEDFADEDFEATLLADFVRYFGLSLDTRESLVQLPKDELLARVLEQAKRAGLVPPDIEASQAHPFIELCKADFRATRNYVLRPYPGRIILFNASQELSGISSDPTLGWSEWAARGVEVYVVPGNHASMVYKPHVEVLAAKLKACLNQAQAAVEYLFESKAL